MAENKLEAQVLTPEGEVFKGELDNARDPTTVGEVESSPNTVRGAARLLPAEVRLHKSDSEVETTPRASLARGAPKPRLGADLRGDALRGAPTQPTCAAAPS